MHLSLPALAVATDGTAESRRRLRLDVILSTTAAARLIASLEASGEPLPTPSPAFPPRATVPVHPRQHGGWPCGAHACRRPRFRRELGSLGPPAAGAALERSAEPRRREPVEVEHAVDAAAVPATGASRTGAGFRGRQLQLARRRLGRQGGVYRRLRGPSRRTRRWRSTASPMRCGTGVATSSATAKPLHVVGPCGARGPDWYRRRVVPRGCRAPSAPRGVGDGAEIRAQVRKRWSQ